MNGLSKRILQEASEVTLRTKDQHLDEIVRNNGIPNNIYIKHHIKTLPESVIREIQWI